MIAIRPMLKRRCPSPSQSASGLRPGARRFGLQASLFAVFVAAIASVLLGSFPTPHRRDACRGPSSSPTITPARRSRVRQFQRVARGRRVHRCASRGRSRLGRQINLLMVANFGGSSLGLAYSIVLTDAAIAPAFPSNTARGGVLFPIVLSVAKGAGSEPDDPEGRRLGGFLMFCTMASLAVSSALWMTGLRQSSACRSA